MLTKYYVNGKKVSKKEFNAYLQKHGQDSNGKDRVTVEHRGNGMYIADK